jgi:hypothetical protein
MLKNRSEFIISYLVPILQDIKEKRDQDLLVLPTDAALFEDPKFKVISDDQLYGVGIL